MREIIGEYRCSCCNGVKKIPNYVYKTWDSSKRIGTSEVVVICRKCNMAMKKSKKTGVLQYLKKQQGDFNVDQLKEIANSALKQAIEENGDLAIDMYEQYLIALECIYIGGMKK